MDGKIMGDPRPPISVVWYQAPVTVATNAIHISFYDAVILQITERLRAFSSLQVEWVMDPATDTINLAGDSFAFAGLEQDLYNAGFRPMEIPNEGMDAIERKAFREMILHGGKLNG